MVDNNKQYRDEKEGTTRRTVLKTVGVAGAGLATSGGILAGDGGASTVARTGKSEVSSGTGATTGKVDGSGRSGHEISTPTTITASGVYEVVTDITSTGSQPCIEIQADDVTLQGNGHELSGDGNGIGVAVNLDATDGGLTIRESIAVEDLHVTNFGTGIQYDSVSGGRIEGVTARNNGTGVGFLLAVTNVTLRDSTLADSSTGFSTVGDPDVYGGPGGNLLEHNAIESNDVGIDLGFSTTDHEFVRNRIAGNGGGARHRRVDSNGHTYSRNVICANPDYGIRNEDKPAEGGIPAFEDVVEATDNYWGAANGPSSIGTPASPFEDPMTGALADGDGDGISESLDPGIANVRFDPFLASAPADAGLQ